MNLCGYTFGTTGSSAAADPVGFRRGTATTDASLGVPLEIDHVEVQAVVQIHPLELRARAQAGVERRSC